jgi:hypothetical protein
MTDRKKHEPHQSRPRSSYMLCHEAAHFVVEEQRKRKRLGLPHDKKVDIVNDWIVDSGKRLGHKDYGGE